MDYSILSKITNILSGHSINYVVISPGSRSAPLTISFARNPNFKKFVIADERSAGYIALGLSWATNSPVAIVCTSGTAVYNLAPAVSEAFYQQIPLLVLTADRPAEWIDQSDGQSIHQDGIYEKNIKKSYLLPDSINHPDVLWHTTRMISEAVLESIQPPMGPVHINFPFREPLYPDNQNIKPTVTDIKIIQKSKVDLNLSENVLDELSGEWEKSSKILIVPGQSDPDKDTLNHLKILATNFSIPVLADVISNLNAQPEPFVYKHDLFLDLNITSDISDLSPELLITFGKSIVSKNLKLFLRKYRPKLHWHIQPSGYVPDTYQSLTRIIPTTPVNFLNQMTSRFQVKSSLKEYCKKWSEAENKTRQTFISFIRQNEFSEMSAVNKILEHLPTPSNLHLANSLSVRIVNNIGLQQENIRIFSNRGTSGIDGCTSTAVGVSLVSENMNILITGDMAFFYDRNAFWHRYDISNFRIVLLNNHGGEIFRMIEGPKDLPELNE